MTPNTLTARSARRLAQRRPLHLDPARSIAIKRNLHEALVDCPATSLAAALEAVLVDPEAAFGVIRILRPADRLGRPFEVGDRFLGCFGVGLGRALEERFLSDFGEIEHIARAETGTGVFEVCYRYLSGSPIAGRSVYRVAPVGDEQCRFSAVFEYQELGMLALTVLQRFGHRAHDRIVALQLERAAARVGARVSWSSLPAA